MEQYTEFEIIRTLSNGMEAAVWLEDDGWHGEVADPGDHCQGAAWGVTTRDEAVTKVVEECEYIEHCVQRGY